MGQVLFYSPKDSYGGFSNFSRHEVEVFGLRWETSEHAFQAMKFHPHRPDLVQSVQKAVGPTRAAEIGRTRSNPIRPDWDTTAPLASLEVHFPGTVPFPVVNDGRGPSRALELVKDLVMYEVCLAKFSQHEDLRKILTGTGNAGIIENAIHDPYWGWGSSRTGVNRLGKILMVVRDKLR